MPTRANRSFIIITKMIWKRSRTVSSSWSSRINMSPTVLMCRVTTDSPGDLTNLELKKAEMYDLRRDPGERYDVISQYPEEAAKLMKIADDMRKDLGDNLTRVKGPGRREPGKLK